LALSNALYDEYSGKIDVLAVKPSTVSTLMTSNIKGFGVRSPEEVIAASLKQLGHSKETFGHWEHVLHSYWARFDSFYWFLLEQGRRWRASQV